MWVLYGPAKVPFSPFSSLVKLEGRRALARGGEERTKAETFTNLNSQKAERRKRLTQDDKGNGIKILNLNYDRLRAE